MEGRQIVPTATREDAALRLASTLSTRLCHDVSGLLGTLAGVLDLIDEDPEARGLATETVAVLIARVRLLRAAWGGGGGPMDGNLIATLAAGLPGFERLKLDVSALPGELAETPARLTLCLLLAALPGMPRGGSIAIAGAPGGGARLILDGPGVGWTALTRRCAESDSACWEAADAPRDLAAPLACLLAASVGWRVSIEGRTATIGR